jgi:deoxyribose-phosphate aldolase
MQTFFLHDVDSTLPAMFVFWVCSLFVFGCVFVCMFVCVCACCCFFFCTGFPAGQTPLKTRLGEIRQAVADGAREIDVVIPREHAIRHEWKLLYDEVKAMKEACGDVHMKTILAVGELPDLRSVYRCSLVAMMAGSDFIKTSTGKESSNATLPVGLVMVRALREYCEHTGFVVGVRREGVFFGVGGLVECVVCF